MYVIILTIKLITYNICFQNELEKLDPRGRTPLMLAITLGDLESTRLLIMRGANVNVKNDEGWTGKIKINMFI